MRNPVSIFCAKDNYKVSNSQQLKLFPDQSGVSVHFAGCGSWVVRKVIAGAWFPGSFLFSQIALRVTTGPGTHAGCVKGTGLKLDQGVPRTVRMTHHVMG